jgi:hypothetical protein
LCGQQQSEPAVPLNEGDPSRSRVDRVLADLPLSAQVLETAVDDAAAYRVGPQSCRGIDRPARVAYCVWLI